MGVVAGVGGGPGAGGRHGWLAGRRRRGREEEEEEGGREAGPTSDLGRCSIWLIACQSPPLRRVIPAFTGRLAPLILPLPFSGRPARPRPRPPRLPSSPPTPSTTARSTYNHLLTLLVLDDGASPTWLPDGLAMGTLALKLAVCTPQADAHDARSHDAAHSLFASYSPRLIRAPSAHIGLAHPRSLSDLRLRQVSPSLYLVWLGRRARRSD